MNSHLLASGDNRFDNVSGLETEVMVLVGFVFVRETVFVSTTYLPGSMPHTLDKQRTRNLHRQRFDLSHTSGIQPVRLRQLQPGSVPLRLPPGTRRYRKPSGLEG